MPPLPPWSMEIMDAFLRRYEIDAAVLSLAPPGVFFGDVGFARELARMVNERIASIVRAEPDRFAGLAVVPLPDVEGALDELAHALDDLGLDGVILQSNVAGVYPGDPAWDPFFDELERRGAYAFLHPTFPPHPLPLDHPVWLYEFTFE